MPAKVSNVTTARPISHYQKQPSSNDMKQQTSDAKELTVIEKQQKIIEELLDSLGRLEGTVSAMYGELAVVRNVNTILSQQLDEAEQYSRRSCMVVMGLRKPEKDERNNKDSKRDISAIASEGELDKGEFMRYVDKVHPVGGTKNDKESRIIKFTTHSFKEKVFLKHKQNQKNEIEKRKQNPKQNSRIQLNVQPSLSRFRIELLKKQMKPSKIMKTSNFKIYFKQSSQ